MRLANIKFFRSLCHNCKQDGPLSCIPLVRSCHPEHMWAISHPLSYLEKFQGTGLFNVSFFFAIFIGSVLANLPFVHHTFLRSHHVTFFYHHHQYAPPPRHFCLKKFIQVSQNEGMTPGKYTDKHNQL